MNLFSGSINTNLEAVGSRPTHYTVMYDGYLTQFCTLIIQAW